MPKNIVIFSDGTGQDGGVRPEQRMSNVYKLYRACRVGPDTDIDPAEQVAFYDPGLGTDSDAAGVAGALRTIAKLLSSVTGTGITTNIADCYEFIVNHYREGDRIFLIGFSRGAYTVRCVANVLWLCGVPTVGRSGPLHRFRKEVRDIADEAVFEVYEHGAGHPRVEYEAERKEKARRFRHKYASGDDDGSNVAPHFIGVFDTVAALGAHGWRRLGIGVGLTILALAVVCAVAAPINLLLGFGFLRTAAWLSLAAGLYAAWVWTSTSLKVIRNSPADGRTHWHFAQWSASNFDRLLSGRVHYARSANAIDETRADFNRLAWGGQVRQREPGEPEPLLQWWFAGNHSDIGGSYPEVESRLSDIPLQWMIDEARSIPGPLIVQTRSIPVSPPAATSPHSDPSPFEYAGLRLRPSADGVQHCEVAGTKDTIERRTWPWLRFATKGLGWQVNVRKVDPEHGVLHPTVLARLALPAVVQCGIGEGPYRPEALRHHHLAERFFVAEAAAPGDDQPVGVGSLPEAAPATGVAGDVEGNR